MNKLIFFIIFLGMFSKLYSQDCTNYYETCHKNDPHEYYVLVKSLTGNIVSISSYITSDDSIESYFDLYAGRDYRMSICSDYYLKPLIKLYEINSGRVIYDNSEQDTVGVIEFEQDIKLQVHAVISFPKMNDSLLYARDGSVVVFRSKPKRYCIGFKLETMITRK